jgi:hypothetical protein
MLPTLRSRFATPSILLAMLGAMELSTVEWHTAQVRPTDLSVPFSLKNPLTPRTAFNLISRRSNGWIVQVNSAALDCLHHRAGESR